MQIIAKRNFGIFLKFYRYWSLLIDFCHCMMGYYDYDGIFCQKCVIGWEKKIRLGGNFAFQKRMLSERKMEGVECDFNSKLWENINIDIKVEGVKYNFNSKPGESHYDNSVSMVWKEPWNYLKLDLLNMHIMILHLFVLLYFYGFIFVIPKC